MLFRRQIHPVNGKIRTTKPFPDAKNIQPAAELAAAECNRHHRNAYAQNHPQGIASYTQTLRKIESYPQSPIGLFKDALHKIASNHESLSSNRQTA